MHQYTADLANRMSQLGHAVHLVTTKAYPAHRYLPQVTVHTPVETRNTGFSREGLRLSSARRVTNVLLQIEPEVVHFSGPHLWNHFVIQALRKAGIATVHTLHDLDPHPGTIYGPLLYVWNHGILRSADHILVHANRYRDRLLKKGIPEHKVTSTPLLHLFIGHTWLGKVEAISENVTYEPFVLFFGRLERYKGVAHLLTAWSMMDAEVIQRTRLVLAGRGKLERLWAGPLPPNVDILNRLIDDEDAIRLFSQCALLVLPYTGATQSALIPAAYFFRKPVIASPSGALSEYVEEGKTGWIVEPEHPSSLARALVSGLSDFDRLRATGKAGRVWYDHHRVQEERLLVEMYEKLRTHSHLRLAA
ncbi:MAG: glycosyltransferase family 4 protein [Anaerolineae bacterium]|nr:glycosyltransferase family 4 protein [Anaerolineae bacterium]